MKYLFRQVTASSRCPLSNRLAENSVEILTHRYEKRARSQALTHTWPCRPRCSASEARVSICWRFGHQKAKTKVPSTVGNRSQVNATLSDGKGAVVSDKDAKPHTSQGSSETTQTLTGWFIYALDSLYLFSMGVLVALDRRGCRQVHHRRLVRALPARMQQAVKPQVLQTFVSSLCSERSPEALSGHLNKIHAVSFPVSRSTADGKKEILLSS